MNRIATISAAAALAISPLAVTAVSLEAAAAPATTTSVSAKAPAYSVTAKADRRTAIAKEDKVKVTGRVSPRAAGEKVTLQQRVGDKKSWKKTATAKIRRNGTYVLKDKPTTPGSREYRVLKPGHDGIRQGVSKPLPVVVYGWAKLAYRSVGPHANVAVASTTIGTDDYTPSLVTETAGTASFIEFTLGRKCTQLRSTYALTDSAATGSSGSVTVTADGTVRANHALAVGTVVADQVTDITDAYRLRFDLATSAVPAAVAAVAEPEVLCTR